MKKYFPNRSVFIVNRQSLRRRLKAKRCYRIITHRISLCWSNAQLNVMCMAWPKSQQAHTAVLLQEQAYRGVFSDSGCWDSYILRSFDRVVRSAFFLTIVPLSEHSIVERAATKLSNEMHGLTKLTPLQTTSQVYSLLRYFSVSTLCLTLVAILLYFVV